MVGFISQFIFLFSSFFDLNGLEMSFKKWQILSLLKNLSCFTNDDLWNRILTLFIALYFCRRDRHKVDNGHNKIFLFCMLKQQRHRFLMVSESFFLMKIFISCGFYFNDAETKTYVNMMERILVSGPYLRSSFNDFFHTRPTMSWKWRLFLNFNLILGHFDRKIDNFVFFFLS